MNMRPLAPRVDLIAPSPTLALDAKAKAMQAQGHDIVNFGIGEPDFETPAHIKEAAIAAINDGFTRYTPADGTIELKEAVCQKFKRDNGLDYNPAQIVISNGGKHSLFNAFLALFSAGDEVIIPAPYWVSYPPLVTLAGAKAVIAETTAKNDYLLTPETLEKAITPNTKALIINSPSNPTGMAYTQRALEALAPIILKHNLWLISDDIYEKIMFDGQQFVNMPMVVPELGPQTIIINGLSKTYAMTGWRIGFMAAPEKVARAAAKIQSQTTSNPSSISQKAAVAALSGPQEDVKTMVASFARRRDLVLSLLAELPKVTCPKPSGSFYVFPDVSAYLTD
ncbi:MAG: pyridoxal phosphate-dependent aminotransferase, partial [Candidatus Adiutrix sp.]